MRPARAFSLAALTVAVVGLAWLPEGVPAGDLQPPGPPAPTMKTLDEIPPSWHRLLPADRRFRLVMPAIAPGCVDDPPVSVCFPVPEAALDLETGLVWELFPDATRRSRREAEAACHDKVVGGRKGWRLPTIEELATLVDPARTAPALPAGHPFVDVRFNAAAILFVLYWSSSGFPETPVTPVLPPFPPVVDTEVMDFADGGVSVAHSQGSQLLAWCVRGSRGHNGR